MSPLDNNAKGYLSISKNTNTKNPYLDVLEFLKSWPERTLSIEELRAKGVSPIIRSIIKTLIYDYKVKDEKLLEVPKEELDKYQVDLDLLIKALEEEAKKWDLEHSNSLYNRYKILLEHGYTPRPLKIKAKWKDFSEGNKIYTLAYYVMEALKRDKDFVTLASIDKPITFYYVDKKPLVFNQEAYGEFVKELGLDEDEPITGSNLAILILQRYGYDESDIRAFYLEIVRTFIKPTKMRLPPCIEALAFKPMFYDLEKKAINEDALRILASWFKYYSRGFSNGRMLEEEDNRIALFSYLVTRVYEEEILEPWKVIEKFKEFYQEAKPFKCGMVEEFQDKTKYAICNFKCPFQAPISKVEEALAKVEKVELYGSDYIQIEHSKKKFLEEFGSLKPTSKLVQKFSGFLGEIYGDPFIDNIEALEVLKALLERARYVSNYLSPLVAVEEWFKEELEKFLEEGALPWEHRAKDRPFLSKDGKVLYIHPDLIRQDLEVSGPEGYTTQKLIKDLKKLPNSPILGISTPIKVKKDSYTEEETNARFWMISVRWLKEQGIEVKVQVPTLEVMEVPGQELAQEDPEKGEEEKPTPIENMILEMTKEPIDIDELAERVSKAFKVEEEEVIAVVTSLMSKNLVRMEEGAKIRRVLNG